METIASAATENGLQLAIELVKRHWRYLSNYKDNLEVLKKNFRDLKDARDRVQHQVNEAVTNNSEEILGETSNWLDDVNKEIKEFETFLGDGNHARTGRSTGFFPKNLLLRYKLGRKAMKIVEGSNVSELVNKNFDRVSYRPDPSIDAALSNIGYKSFPSRKQTEEGINKALEDPSIRMIGVYGAGGLGKTTLVKHVAKKAIEKKLFNKVVMANITRNPDIKKVQGQIAEMLGMRLEEESKIVRAGRLRRRLKHAKENILVILDDLWDGVDLNILGILNGEDDEGDDDGNNQRDRTGIVDIVSKKMNEDYKGCKILLTSRRKEVLCGEMNVQENSTFLVGLLEENEALTFLKKEAGVQDTDSQLDKLAIEIAKMCVGFPIALASIGRILKNKSPFIWNDVCGQLSRHNFLGEQESIEFSTKLSYDHLKNEELKSIFLLCAKMGNDPLIMDLVKYCVGLGMLQGIYTIREARDRVQVLLEELKGSSLLFESYSNDRFNMHDIVRDVALSIASKEKHVFTMRNGKLDMWPHKDKVQSYTGISLHYCDIIDGLPESIDCPRLEFFHVDTNDPLMNIPDNWFEGMTELRVLVLSGFHLSCLPSSIRYLKNLRMLCLERCTLEGNISIIGELRKLRILSLTGSKFENLPLELGNLNKLQLFDLSKCSILKSTIPLDIISKLNNLEELYMEGDKLIQWETEERNQSGNANLYELMHLNQLRTLQIHIPSLAHFPGSLFLDKLDNYKIVIGELNMLSTIDFKMPPKYEVLKLLALHLKEGSHNIHYKKGIKMLLKGVENLLLGELNGVNDVLYELSFEGFPNLKHLSIVNNLGIQYIIKSMEQLQPLEAFTKLETIFLFKLDNLKKLCDNQLIGATFSRLKSIKIKTCGRLRNFFSVSMVRLLTELETIEVCDCDSLKEIVSIETTGDVKDDKNIEFPRLRFLILESLPTLSCFYADENDKVPDKELVEITSETQQNGCLSLFNNTVLIPNLECLQCRSIQIQNIWSDQPLISHSFQSLLTLNVTDCGSLKYLLSFSVAGSLVNLESLFVSGCEMMEDIFKKEEAREIDILPKLKKMEISTMKKLNKIWHSNIGLKSFMSLESVVIKECDKLATVFPGYISHSLQILEVINCKSVENIFKFVGGTQPHKDRKRKESNLCTIVLVQLPNLVHVWNEDAQGSLAFNFNNLKEVKVHQCESLENLFPPSVADCLTKLERLDLFYCLNMKKIVATEDGSNEDSIFTLPQLTILIVQYLPILESFCGRLNLEWPLLKTFVLCGCENFEVEPILSATEKVISNLETIALGEMQAKWLQNYMGNIHRMRKLKSLMFDGLKNTEILYWILHRIPSLQSLHITNCSLREVWAAGSLATHKEIGSIVQLKEFKLCNFFSLQKIGFEYDLLLQRVERLEIQKCHSLINLVSSSASFSQMTYLEVTECNKLRNLMAPSTAKSLVQLKIMKIIECKLMMEIVIENKNEAEKVEEIDFKHLKALELVSLESLSSFCSSDNYGLKFPVLEKLIVSECPKMKMFSPGVISLPNLQKLCVPQGEDKDRWYWEGDLNATIQKIYMDKVSLEYLKHVSLSNYSELKQVWYGKVPLVNNCFHNLKTLMVEKCEFLKDIVIPSYVLPYFKNLEELHVRNCSRVEVIFDINGLDINKLEGMIFRLKKLTLDQLPYLKHVWNKSPQGILNFPNLRELDVRNCASLKTLLPASLARNLGKLERVEIHHCKELVQVVGKENATKKYVFEFPCLSTLMLFGLPLLSYFYPGSHILECPKLDCLKVAYCDKLTLFTSELDPEHQVITNTHQKPLFLVSKVIIPNLKELTVNEKMVILLSNGQLSSNSLHKLIQLELCFEEANEEAALPFEFLHKVPNLKSLRVLRFDNLRVIFPSQKLQVHDGLFPLLENLTLWKLPLLKSIGLEHSWVNPHCEKLKYVWVYECILLEKLVSGAISFSSLKYLRVERCNRLKYLFTFSTAKSLVHLEVLMLEECKLIKEIIMIDENDESASGGDIIFGQLWTLHLVSLPKLVCFYSGNATLQFSRLIAPRVIQCPMMRTFSRGLINAPMFQMVDASLDFNHVHLHHHHHLNSTIENMFTEKVACRIQELKLGDQPELEEIWLRVVPIPTNCFNKLKYLIVVKCESLSYVIPFHLLPFLCNLKSVKVSDCESVKTIFDLKGRHMINDKPASLVSLPLKELILDRLPNLEHIWNMNPDGILSLRDLQMMFVERCQSLKFLFPTSAAFHHLVKLEELEVEYCEGLVEIVAEDEAELNIGETKQFIFRCLTSLTLSELPELKYFYRGKHLLEGPMLKYLSVSHCDKLKLFTTEHEHESSKETNVEAQQAINSVEKAFPNLKELSLVWIGTQIGILIRTCLFLECFHDDQSDIHSWINPFLQTMKNSKIEDSCYLKVLAPSTMSFSNLTKLIIFKCHELQYLLTSSTVKSLNQLKEMCIDECESIQEIVKKEGEFDSDQDKIIFKYLNIVSLRCLPCLVSFYKGTSTFECPSLKKVFVRECGNMRRFCEGNMYAPEMPNHPNTLVQNLTKGLRNSSSNLPNFSPIQLY